tara:strand:+ start:1458 stop:1766 length:309 start_codon:yes stop_codon:yes gene_type:complete
MEYTKELVDTNTYKVTTTVDGKEEVFQCIVRDDISELDELVSFSIAGLNQAPVEYVQTYVDKRREAYPSLEAQADMAYWDRQNSTTTLDDAIKAVKDEHPKP